LSAADSKSSRALFSAPSSLIKQGVRQSNLLAVVASGSTLVLYINHIKAYSTTDSTFSGGTFALLAIPEKDKADVIYSNAKLWAL
jgi:hypothetical protein